VLHRNLPLSVTPALNQDFVPGEKQAREQRALSVSPKELTSFLKGWRNPSLSKLLNMVVVRVKGDRWVGELSNALER
jgi:hypothetical protein